MLVAGTCLAGSRWSDWQDRDDPSFSGDHEILKLAGICQDPTGAEGRIVGATATTTTQEVSFDLSGLVCLNSLQTGNCFDYEVRFCCPDTVTDHSVGKCNAGAPWHGKWSRWMDRDDETFSGDHEHLRHFYNDHQKDFQGTGLCLNPSAAQARIVGSRDVTQVQVSG